MNPKPIKDLMFGVEELMYSSFHSLHINKDFPSEGVRLERVGNNLMYMTIYIFFMNFTIKLND